MTTDRPSAASGRTASFLSRNERPFFGLAPGRNANQAVGILVRKLTHFLRTDAHRPPCPHRRTGVVPTNSDNVASVGQTSRLELPSQHLAFGICGTKCLPCQGDGTRALSTACKPLCNELPYALQSERFPSSRSPHSPGWRRATARRTSSAACTASRASLSEM